MKFIDIAVRAFALLPYIYLIRELFRKSEEEPEEPEEPVKTTNPYLIHMVREAKKRKNG